MTADIEASVGKAIGPWGNVPPMTHPDAQPERIAEIVAEFIEDRNATDERAALENLARALAGTEAAAPSLLQERDRLDVERLGQALHEARIGCDVGICDPTPALYQGLRRTMHETDARDLLVRLGAASGTEETPPD